MKKKHRRRNPPVIELPPEAAAEMQQWAASFEAFCAASMEEDRYEPPPAKDAHIIPFKPRK